MGSRLFFALVFFVVPVISGCDGTAVSYEPNLPLNIKFTFSGAGKVSVSSSSAGLKTPLGTFKIRHKYDIQKEKTYVVLRDHAREVDTVYELNTHGYVKVDAQAISFIINNMANGAKEVVIDILDYSGEIIVNVFPGDITASIYLNSLHQIILTMNKKFVVQPHILKRVYLGAKMGEKNQEF